MGPGPGGVGLVAVPVGHADGDDAEGEQRVLLGVAHRDDALGLLFDGGAAEGVLDGHREGVGFRRRPRWCWSVGAAGAGSELPQAASTGTSRADGDDEGAEGWKVRRIMNATFRAMLGVLTNRAGSRVPEARRRPGSLGGVTDADATPIHIALGLTDSELGDIVSILGREPNRLELSMYSVMWSEHCSYKSSRIHLKRLPTTGEGVLVGPGENAGVMDVGDGIAAAIRIESHNHPSYIEPYQGAATGAGGILRDIFTMGARPIALMDPLRFGPLDDARSRWVAEGVVSGISGYGNSVGVPTVGGEVIFDECYKGNPLVNVLCLGILPGRPPGPRPRPPAPATWPCCSARPPAATASAA